MFRNCYLCFVKELIKYELQIIFLAKLYMQLKHLDYP